MDSNAKRARTSAFAGAVAGGRASAKVAPVRIQMVGRRGTAGRRRTWRDARSTTSRQELKGVDTMVAGLFGEITNTVNDNTDIIALNLAAPGNASFNRIGRKMKMMSIRLKGGFQSNTAPTDATSPQYSQLVRMTLVYDRQPTGAAPIFSTIFGTTDQAGSELVGFESPVRYDNTARFKVIRDWMIDLRPFGVATVGGQVVWTKCEFDEYVKLGGLETVFGGQSNPCTVADIANGALFLVVRRDANNALNAVQFVAGTFARLRFYD